MHRVYVQDGDVWTLASVYALTKTLPTPEHADDYVVLETERPPSVQRICAIIEDGRLLCDIGPEHDHDGGDF